MNPSPAASCLLQRPSLALLGAEPFRAAFEFARLQRVKTSPSKPGDGHAVEIFSGLGADGSSVAMLRNHCRSLGYESFDWGQGFNTGPQGDLDAWLEVLKGRVTKLLSDHKRPATLIGWCLGRLMRGNSAALDPALKRIVWVRRTVLGGGMSQRVEALAECGEPTSCTHPSSH
jgi:hypothetical protein